MTKETWEFMDPALSSTQLTECYQSYTTSLVDHYCPKKVISFRPTDKPYITENMKQIKRQTMREYEKHGKSQKYFNLKQSFENKMQSEAGKYKNKVIEEVVNGNRGSTYAALRKLGERPGENNSNSFSLPVFDGLTSLNIAEKLADHFAEISGSYNPLNIDHFNPKLRQALKSPDMSVIPQLQEYEVYKRIQKSKKPNSTVPGDIPAKLIKEFSCEISKPLTILYNKILSIFEYPR